MSYLRIWMLFALSVWSWVVVAEPPAVDPEMATLRETLAKLVPGREPDALESAGVPGLYTATFGPEVLILSADGRYLISGDIVDLSTRKSIIEPRKRGARRSAIEAIGEENMIVYGPKDAEHTVTVFTDIDCGYCRKLHSEMKQYNDLGIRIRYLAYPRAGIGSRAYRDAVAVWCSDDPKDAMTRAKQGQKLPAKECENPVKKEYSLGRVLGVSGTPTLITEQGRLLPGYLPPKRLLQVLEQP